MSEVEESQDQYYSTGRGGKGNITATKSADLQPQRSTASQLTSTFSHDKDGNFVMSTGRGGQANLVHTTSPPTNPPLQPTISSSSQLQPVYSTGRGGFGNMQSNRISEDGEGEATGNPKEKKGLLKKVKKLFQ